VFPIQNFAILFGVQKLEWWCYQTSKRFGDIFSHFDTHHEHDRWTDSIAVSCTVLICTVSYGKKI